MNFYFFSSDVKKSLLKFGQIFWIHPVYHQLQHSELGIQLKELRRVCESRMAPRTISHFVPSDNYNRLAFVMEIQCVVCEVETASSHIIYMYFVLQNGNQRHVILKRVI